MRRFRFQFEPLLKQRKTREEEALRALANAQRAHQQEIERKGKLLSTLEQALSRREGLGAQSTPVSAFLTEQDHIDGTKLRIAQCEQAIARAMRGVEKALRAYLHARRQLRTIELLYERHFEAYKLERRRREAKELDDLTVMRHSRTDRPEEAA